MQMFNGMHRGSLEVTSDLVMSGTVTGDLIVLNGLVLIQGVVGGDVRVLGGVADVHGRIGGASGNLDAVRVAVGASVAGRVLGPDMRWRAPEGVTVVRGDAPTYPMSQIG